MSATSSLGRVGGDLAESLAWLNSPSAIAAEIAHLEGLQRAGDTSEATRAQLADWRVVRTARACGLKYYSRADTGRQVRHHCGAILIDRVKRADFTLNVGTDGRCGSCGGLTPIIGISREEYDELQHETTAAA